MPNYFDDNSSKLRRSLKDIERIADQLRTHCGYDRFEKIDMHFVFKTVKVKENIPDLIQFALDNGTNFKMLKAYNPWLLKDGLVVEKGKEYKLKIPEQDGDSLEQFESEIPADHSEGFQAEGAETGENRSGKEESN